MKRGYAKRKSGSSANPRRVRLHHFERSGAILLLSVAMLSGLEARGMGQQPPLWPKTVTIDVAKPLAQVLEYRLSETTPQRRTEINFKADGTVWRFVRFEHLPEKVALKVNGERVGYLNSEPLQPQKWYAFRSPLSVILEIDPDAQMPVEVAVFYGGPELAAGQTLLKDLTLGTDVVRKFPENNPVKVIARQSLQFFWDTPALSAGPSPTASPMPESFWAYLTEEEPFFAVFVLFVVVGGCALLAIGILPRLSPWLRYRRVAAQYAPKGKPKPASKTTAPPAGADGMYESLGRHVAGVYPPPKSQAPPTSPPATPPPRLGQNESQRLIDQKAVSLKAVRDQKVGEQDRVTLADLLAQLSDAVPGTKAASTDEQSAPAYEAESLRLRHDVDQLRKEMDELLVHVGRQFHTTSEGQQRVHSKLNDLRQRGDEAAQVVSTLLETEIGGVRRDLLRAMKAQQTEFNHEHESRNEWIEKKSADGINELRLEINEVREQLNQLGDARVTTDVPDSFYARTLGEVLAQNIEMLQDATFEQLSQQLGERLNQFFKTEVPPGDSLRELREHCEAVDAALIDVTAEMAKLNAKVADATSPHLRRSAALVVEVANLQEQLQNRRLSVETTLRIPVSAYPGARQTFTDALGRGIKREIDKLSEPQKYLTADLYRLITTDVIAVVDICDKEVAHPGTRPELETALNQLFVRAGLLPIVPRQGEAFKAVEQDLLHKVQNGSGMSSGIAQVVTRGFYYDGQDGKTLLRKAGVAVYR